MDVVQAVNRSPSTKKEALKAKPEVDTEDLKGFESDSGPGLNASDDDCIKTRSRSATPKKAPKKTEREETAPKPVEVTESEPKADRRDSGKGVNDEPTTKSLDEKKTATNGVKNDEEFCLPAEVSEEMEPLTVEAEEADPELQFDENSDVESHKSSPVVSRCMTRRSQTRNIPTPRTPKSAVDQNGEEKDSETAIDTPESSVTPDIQPSGVQPPYIPSITESMAETDSNAEVPDNVETASEMSHRTEETEPDKFYPADLNETRESFDSATSMKVNVGSDVTREIDVSLLDKSSFLNQAKDLTVVETVRLMRCRKSIRQDGGDYRKNMLKTNVEKHGFTIPSRSSRVSMERLSGTKRKRSETPDGVKRFKLEPQQQQHGFLSYLTSPLNTIRNRFSPREMSASTPKLTSFRQQGGLLDDGEISEIENDTGTHAERKWCSIM